MAALLAIGAFAAGAAAADGPPLFTGADDPLRAVENKVISGALADADLTVDQPATAAAAFARSREAYRRYAVLALSATDDEPPYQAIYTFQEVAAAAAKAHPNVTAVVALHAYADNAGSTPDAAMLPLAPVAHDWPGTPGIAFTLYRAFRREESNARWGADLIAEGGHQGILRSRHRTIFEEAGMSPAEAADVADALAVLWAHRVDREAAGRLWSGTLPEYAQRELTSELRRKAAIGWRIVHATSARREAQAQLTAMRERQAREQSEHLEQLAAQRERQRERLEDQQFQRALEAVTDRLTAESVDVDDIRAVMRMLRSNRDRLEAEGVSDLPNLAKVQAVRPDIAVAANAFYADRVLEDRALALRRLKEVDISDNAPALYIRAMIETDSGELDQAEATLGRILELNPRHLDARRLLLTIEKMRDGKPQPEAEAVSG